MSEGRPGDGVVHPGQGSRACALRLANAVIGLAFATAFCESLVADRTWGATWLRLETFLDPLVLAAVVLGVISVASVVWSSKPLVAAAALLCMALAAHHLLGGAMLAMSIHPAAGRVRIAVSIAALAWASWLLVAQTSPRRRPGTEGGAAGSAI